jgi:hypothetical protein
MARQSVCIAARFLIFFGLVPLFLFDDLAGSGSLRGERADEDSAKFDKLSEIFLAVDGGSVKEKKWVRAETGPSNWKEELEGWLLQDAPKSIQLLDPDGFIHSIPKPRPGEQRPKGKEGNMPFPEYLSIRYAAVWSVPAGDFRGFCKDFVDKGVPDLDRKRQGFQVVDAGRSELSHHVITACHYACWAEQSGHHDLARLLLRQAEKAHALYRARFAEGSAVLHLFVAERLASQYRIRAVAAGHGGTARPEVLRAWEAVAKIPHHKYRKEADEMIRGYKALIAEDRAWGEPDKTTLAKMTAEQKAAYWLHHLRDANAGQNMDPGRCCVVLEWSYPMVLGEPEDKTPKPAIELEKLGMAAIPQIIAHLDDPRPTRCQGHWRRYWPESFYLLRYGDCCQQIFESITGYTIYERKDTNGYPMKDGKGAECKAQAESWWRDYQKKRLLPRR